MWPGALLVLVGYVCGAPSTAEAGCGHYATSNADRSHVDSPADVRLFRADAGETSASGPAAPLRDVPCSGPTCSRGTGIPVVPASLASVRTDLWCNTTASASMMVPTLPADRADERHLNPRDVPNSIERPPR
jgi:hypothetical protein